MGRWVKAVGVVALAGLLVEAALVLPLSAWSTDLVAWIRGAGALGVAVYAAAYIVATVLLLPGSILTLGAGFAYGPLLGTMLVSPVSVTAATLAFLLGRTSARRRMQARMSGDPRFVAIDEAVGRNGLRLVILLRLSPVFPFNVLNYALGLTQVGLRDYVLGSFVGMLPGTFLYVYLGSLVTSVTSLAGDRPSGGFAQEIFYWGGLAATVVVTVLIARIARRALNDALRSSNAADAPREAGA